MLLDECTDWTRIHGGGKSRGSEAEGEGKGKGAGEKKDKGKGNRNVLDYISRWYIYIIYIIILLVCSFLCRFFFFFVLALIFSFDYCCLSLADLFIEIAGLELVARVMFWLVFRVLTAAAQV